MSANDSANSVTRSRTPSVDTQSYSIAEPEHMDDIDDSDTSNNSEERGSEGSGCSISVSESAEEFLDEMVPTTSTSFKPNDTPDPGTIFDISKYVFESLKQAIDSSDFSDALALQTKTSAVINAKSLELKQLIDETKVRLPELQEKFKKGQETSKNIKRNIEQSRNRIETINALLQTDHPIEFNQARDKILERTLDDDDEEEPEE
ncbi:Kxd1p [Nakaseomyces bracarensis]|uniref:Kxd1p n=1 Tax=Nakaseomyces bracarensis TaxID=273131 RepID=UPI0038714DEB